METFEIVISTTSKEMADELLSAQVNGLKQSEAIQKVFDPVQFYHISVEAISGLVSVGTIASWIYAAIKKHKPDMTKVDQIVIQNNQTQIEVVINQVINVQEKTRRTKKGRKHK
jgi:hypothetical protein